MGKKKFYEVSYGLKLRLIYFHNTNSSPLWRYASLIPEELEDEGDEELARWIMKNWPDADTAIILPQDGDRTGVVVLDEEARVLNLGDGDE